MKKFNVFLVCMALTGNVLMAQPVQIKGVVTAAADGQPLAGTSVMVKGGKAVALTDANGHYTIKAPGDAHLVFSFIGMQRREVAVAGRRVINVQLEDAALALDNVVVVAYGTTTRERFTGSVSVVSGDKLVRGETSNLTKMLEGAVTGVQAASVSGQPGDNAVIHIRGVGSISAGSNPLIVVDGVPYGGSLNAIAPQDIETFNVLKDAAATSMYGARGSNGVLMITTKRGEAGSLRINLDARVGMNSLGVSPYEVLTNPADYYELTWEAQRNSLVEAGADAAEAGRTASHNLIGSVLRYNIYKGIPDTELVGPVTGKINPAAKERKWHDSWLTDPFKNNLRQEYNLNVSSGKENTEAYFSASYVNDKGYIENSDFSRISVRGKIDQKFRDFLKAGLNVAYAQTASNSPMELFGGGYPNIFLFSQSAAPIYPVYKYDLATGQPIIGTDGAQAYDFGTNNFEDGAPSQKTRAYMPTQNPLYVLQNNDSRFTVDNLSTRTYVEVYLHGFTFTANLAYDVFNKNFLGYANPVAGDGVWFGGYGTRNSLRNAELNANQLLNYSKEMDKHNIDVLLGHEIKADEEVYLDGSKMQFYDPANPELANAGAMSSLTSYTEKYRLEGFLSRVEYSYDKRYMLSGSFRRDASSKFHPNVRWGSFWSVGAAWRAKAEPFLAGIDRIDNLRLRASYGTQGNDAIAGSNLYMDQYDITSDGQYPSPVFDYRGAPNLTWEKSTNLTLGLESRFFDLVTLNVDYFIKETKDMIYQKPLAFSMGAPKWVWDNQIDMLNRGWEIEVAVDVLRSHSLSWFVRTNVTAMKNELTRLPADKTDPKGYQESAYWRKIGGSLYDFYLKQYAGVDEATGKALWYKNDEHGSRQTTTLYSEADYYETGKSAIPDLFGGLSTDVTAFGLELSVQTAFQLGGYVYDAFYASLMSGGEVAGQNWHVDACKRWTPANTHTGVPRLSAGDRNLSGVSDRFLTSASYFSLKNITLGYNFPKNMIDRLSIRSLRVYMSSDNLWLATARKGLDPRQSFSGATLSGAYSALRTVSFGFSMGL